MRAEGDPVKILLVEDSETDVMMTREALNATQTPSTLHVVDNGDDAVRFLRRQPPFGEAPRPDVILLDLNLPRKNGQEVLAEIKADEGLRTIPVVVLTTSKSEEDVQKSYNLHANSYVTKPLDFKQFIVALRAVEQFWLGVATLPTVKQ
jgi:CheY-like chemotaxis protein